MQDPSDPVEQLIHLEKLAVRSQIVIGVRQFADKMPGEKAIHHKKQVALEALSHLFLKGPLFQCFHDQFLNIAVQRIIAVKGVKTILQHVGADIQLLPVQDHSLTCLSHNAEAERLDLLAKLFQVADQRGPAHIHFVSELICQKRRVRAHKLSEHISLPPSRRTEYTVDIAYFLKSAFVLLCVKNPQTVSSLIPFYCCTSAQILVQLADIIPDRPLADTQFLRHGSDRYARFMSENLQNISCPVICKSFVHLPVSPICIPIAYIPYT